MKSKRNSHDNEDFRSRLEALLMLYANKTKRNEVGIIEGSTYLPTNLGGKKGL